MMIFFLEFMMIFWRYIKNITLSDIYKMDDTRDDMYSGNYLEFHNKIIKSDNDLTFEEYKEQWEQNCVEGFNRLVNDGVCPFCQDQTGQFRIHIMLCVDADTQLNLDYKEYLESHRYARIFRLEEKNKNKLKYLFAAAVIIFVQYLYIRHLLAG